MVLWAPKFFPWENSVFQWQKKFYGKPQMTKKFGFEISKSPNKKTVFDQKKSFFGQFFSISNLNRIFNFCPFWMLIP